MNKINEAKKYLELHGAIYGIHYTIGGLGNNVYGIEKIGKFWYSYKSEKPYNYRKTNYIRLGSEDAASDFIIKEGKRAAIKSGSWLENSSQQNSS
ncbi:hypothetical protein [Paracoccus wurundjeri]|uniref:hypothetical protein n=1 Tax=Paracoccus onubensis TaxID=1675788 RepID=UPI00272F9111|nr:hypothetical protein [Paracoccus onubensis]